MSPTKRVRDTAGEAGFEGAVVDAELYRQEAQLPEPRVLPAATPAPAVPDHHEDIVARLRDVGARRTALQEQLTIAELRLVGAIVDAFDAGVPKRAIAREAGVVRQTVYNVLARREAG